MADGDVLRLDGREESYAIDCTAGDLVVLQAEIQADAAPLLVEYDADTLTAVAVSSNDDGASRSQMLLSFLAEAGVVRSTPVVARFTDDPQFFVRWHAMREWLALDPVGALPRLQRMASDDPHPDLRAAASSVAHALTTADAHGGRAACHA